MSRTSVAPEPVSPRGRDAVGEPKQPPIEAVVRRRTRVAEATYEIDLDLLGRRLHFRAGQYCRIRLPRLDAPDRKPSRKFSLVNAPYDDQHAVIATRTGVSGYKCTLCALPPGAPVQIEKVKGSLTLPDSVQRPVVFVAGGIGVAPFVSMLRELEHRDRLDSVTLLYFNRSAASAAYLGELTALAERSAGFTLFPVVTRDRGWAGESARLSSHLLDRVLGPLSGYDFYVVGTPAMVASAVGVLRGAGVDPERVREEDFSGYDEPATSPR